MFEIRGGGSQSVTQVFKTLDFKRVLDKVQLPDGFWIAGDAAYPTSDFLVGPYSNMDAKNADSENFNWAQSQLRIRIEMAFGKLVGLFGILWKPLRMHHARASIIAMTCAKLHNVVITLNDLEHQQYYSDSKKNVYVRTPLGMITEIVDERKDGYGRRRSNRATLALILNKHGGPINLLNNVSQQVIVTAL